jgi:hypothetical protein
MMKRGLFIGFLLIACGISVPAWAESSPMASINSNDHSALVTYYAEQAKELQEKAKFWDMVAETYEKHKDATHAVHCRTIAKDYRQAAKEADALAIEHRGKLPHGVVR